MKRPPLRAFKRASAQAITGPPETPKVESRAARVRNLARHPGVSIEVLTDTSLEIRCEDARTAGIVEHRIVHACALVGVPRFNWSPRPDAPLTFLVTLD